MSHVLRNKPFEDQNALCVSMIQGETQSFSFCSPNTHWAGGRLACIVIVRVATAA